jgi:hypothetical protein
MEPFRSGLKIKTKESATHSIEEEKKETRKHMNNMSFSL